MGFDDDLVNLRLGLDFDSLFVFDQISLRTFNFGGKILEGWHFEFLLLRLVFLQQRLSWANKLYLGKEGSQLGLSLLDEVIVAILDLHVRSLVHVSRDAHPVWPEFLEK